MLLSLEDFVRDLSANQLLSADEVHAVETALPAERRPRDAQELAKELVKSGRLTKYQAANAVQGKTKNLVFDDYVVLDPWPAGGSSQLYQAEHRKMKRRVALRILPPFASDKSSTALARFQREVQAAARLEHAHLLAAYHAGEAHGVPYLVLQYVDGQNLETLVRERGPLPWTEAVQYITQAARALAYAHEKGVVHRDVKPANMLLDKSGTLKVSGLGLARIEDDTDKSVTQTGELLGTPEFMSPEQGQDAKKVDARSDIYSLGCTLYFLLTGKPMYERPTVAQQIVAHCQQAIPLLRERRADVPPMLEAVFAKMVAKSPNDRYAGMTAVIEALDRIGDGSRSKVSTKLVETVVKTKHVTAKVVGGLFATIIAPMIVVYLSNHYMGSSDAPAPVTSQPPATNGATQAAVTGNTAGQPAPADGKNPAGATGAATSGAQVATVPGSQGATGPGSQGATAPAGKTATPQGEQVAAITPDKTTSPTPGKPLAKPPAKLEPKQRELLFPPEIKGKHPNLATAPFPAKPAERHQKAWAKFLNVPVKADNTLHMSLVLIPPGEFSMGSTDKQIKAATESTKRNKAAHFQSEAPQHRVTLSRPFYMSATEVNIGQYRQFVDATGYRTAMERRANPPGTWKLPDYTVNDDSPVTLVTWNDAVEFCNWLSDHEGLPRAYAPDKQDIWKTAPTIGYRLPSEAQWEFGCRAGSAANYSFGDDGGDLPKYGWVGSNSGRHAHAVGGLAANPFGLYDMYGNVNEWCNDWYDENYYASSGKVNPEGPKSGTDRVLRGSGWNAVPAFARSAARGSISPEQANGIRGFRVIRNGPPVPGAGKADK
jgi:formylglycine-generating enzyme required for sulfatase activity